MCFCMQDTSVGVSFQATTLPLRSSPSSPMNSSLIPTFGKWNPNTASSENHFSTSNTSLHSIVEVSPVDFSTSWEVTRASEPLVKGVAVYALPTVELDEDDAEWLHFGFCMAREILEDYGECALVLFELEQEGEEVLFLKFWVNSQLLDGSFFLSPA
jgi:hypothetical protein